MLFEHGGFLDAENEPNQNTRIDGQMSDATAMEQEFYSDGRIQVNSSKKSIKKQKSQKKRSQKNMGDHTECLVHGFSKLKSLMRS